VIFPAKNPKNPKLDPTHYEDEERLIRLAANNRIKAEHYNNFTSVKAFIHYTGINCLLIDLMRKAFTLMREMVPNWRTSPAQKQLTYIFSQVNDAMRQNASNLCTCLNVAKPDSGVAFKRQ